MFLSEGMFALSPLHFERARIVETKLKIREDLVEFPESLESLFEGSLSGEFDLLLFTRVVRGNDLFTSWEHEAPFKRNNYTVKFNVDQCAYAEVRYYVSVGTWKDDEFHRQLTAAVVHPLRTDSCAFAEASMPDAEITNWPSPVIKVQKLEHLQLRSVDRLLCKCAPIIVRGNMYVVEPLNDMHRSRLVIVEITCSWLYVVRAT